MRVFQHTGTHPASSSRESASEPRVKVVSGSGKHGTHTHFPKDKDCEICKRTQITRPRAEKFGCLIKADRKVLSEGCESRNNHRYAVVAQGLAPQCVLVVPVQNENFSGDGKELTKVLGADKETQCHLH